MQPAYIHVTVPLSDAFALTLPWLNGRAPTLIAPSTRSIEETPQLERAGIRLGTTGHRHSRFTAKPEGAVIAWCLSLKEILEIESQALVEGIACVQGTAEHSPWITARKAVCLGGTPIPQIPEANTAVKNTIGGISGLAIQNQGLVDARERSEVVQALQHLREHGHTLEPQQLIVEALRQGWPGTSPLELAKIAADLNAGRRLQTGVRIRPATLQQWTSAES